MSRVAAVPSADAGLGGAGAGAGGAAVPRRFCRRFTPCAATATVPTVAAVRATGAPITPRRATRLVGGACRRPCFVSAISCSMDAAMAWMGMRPLATSWPPARRAEVAKGIAHLFSQTTTPATEPGSHSGRQVHDVLLGEYLGDLLLEREQLVERLQVVDLRGLHGPVLTFGQDEEVEQADGAAVDQVDQADASSPEKCCSPVGNSTTAKSTGPISSMSGVLMGCPQGGPAPTVAIGRQAHLGPERSICRRPIWMIPPPSPDGRSNRGAGRLRSTDWNRVRNEEHRPLDCASPLRVRAAAGPARTVRNRPPIRPTRAPRSEDD